MRRHSITLSVATFGIAVLILSGCTTAAESGTTPAAENVDELSGTVTLMLPNTTTTRFIEHDGPAFVEAMRDLAPGVTVEIVNAEGDAAKQLNQAETAISTGTLGIVLVSADPALSGAVLEKAASANIPVIGYEHEALDGPMAYQVINDPLKVGQAQGAYFSKNLPPTDGPVKLARIYGNNGDNYTTNVKAGQDEAIDALVADGKVDVVCEDYAAGWDPANAQKIIEQCLTNTSNAIDAIIASNDGTASGAIAALEGQKLAGDVPVYGGQDANLEALKFILEGLQVDTVFKDYAVEGAAAAQLMADTLTGTEPSTDLVNAVFDNGFAKIPAAYLPVTSVDITNMQVVVDGGLYTKDEICEGVSTKTDFCG